MGQKRRQARPGPRLRGRDDGRDDHLRRVALRDARLDDPRHLDRDHGRRRQRPAVGGALGRRRQHRDRLDPDDPRVRRGGRGCPGRSSAASSDDAARPQSQVRSRPDPRAVFARLAGSRAGARRLRRRGAPQDPSATRAPTTTRARSATGSAPAGRRSTRPLVCGSVVCQSSGSASSPPRTRRRRATSVSSSRAALPSSGAAGPSRRVHTASGPCLARAVLADGASIGESIAAMRHRRRPGSTADVQPVNARWSAIRPSVEARSRRRAPSG